MMAPGGLLGMPGARAAAVRALTTAPHRAAQRRRLSASRTHRTMPVYYSPIYTHTLPDTHRFPMERYEAVRQTLEARLEPGLLHIAPQPRLATVDELLSTHTPRFVHAYLTGQLSEQEMKVIGFPWTKHFVDRTLCIIGNTLSAMEDVLVRGHMASCNAAGGTHHAFRDHGEGYCIFNDIGCAGTLAIRDHGCAQVLVVDLDVHQGNGTAEIFDGDDSVFTYSVHGDKNYPWRSRHPSDLDVAVPDDITEADYLEQTARGLDEVAARLQHQPDVVIYQAGVDPLTEDRLGRLNISRSGLRKRNTLVFEFCRRHRLPVVCLMGGGYARPIQKSADAHVDVFIQAAQYAASYRT